MKTLLVVVVTLIGLGVAYAGAQSSSYGTRLDVPDTI
jgi:hypothetical protein